MAKKFWSDLIEKSGKNFSFRKFRIYIHHETASLQKNSFTFLFIFPSSRFMHLHIVFGFFLKMIHLFFEIKFVFFMKISNDLAKCNLIYIKVNCINIHNLELNKRSLKSKSPKNWIELNFTISIYKS